MKKNWYPPTEEQRRDLESFEAQDLAEFLDGPKRSDRIAYWILGAALAACLLWIVISLFR